MITYAQGSEHGASLRASGWHKVRDLPPRSGWNSATRPRRDLGTENTARTLWTDHGVPRPTNRSLTGILPASPTPSAPSIGDL